MIPGRRRARSGAWVVVTLGSLGALACSDKAELDLFPGAGGGSCASLAARVRTSELELPSEAMPNDEYFPMPVAARADSSSFVAYRDKAENQVRVLLVDRSDVVESTVLETPGVEAHALLAHDQGGALVFVREDPDIYSANPCSGGPIGLTPCSSLELMRFDDTGAVTLTATLTDKLSVDTEGALFIWWFEHTARIDFADDTYGVYFRSARTIPLANGLTPRPTDSLRFVDASGQRLEGGWDFGCVPSWSVRLVHHRGWAALCHGETPNAHRLVILDGADRRELLLLEGVPPAYRALGGLSVHDDDFLLSYLERASDSALLHLARITSDAEVVFDRIIAEAVDIDFQTEPAYVFRSYHAKLGDDLLLGWKTNDRLALALADIDSGSIIEGPVLTDAPIDHFVEFVSYPNGDVGWAHSAASGKVTLTRVSGCAQ
jgi:hypothetical protein